METIAREVEQGLKRIPEQQHPYGPYIAGFGDGCAWTGNAMSAGAAPEAMRSFAQRVLDRRLPNIRRIAFGLSALELTVFIITEQLDVAETRDLFRIKDEVENAFAGSFSLTVRPLQGRSLDEMTPAGFIF